jgi:LysM repeat protein
VRQRWPRWWLVPLLGLLPVTVAVVLASGVHLGAPSGQTVATGPLATGTTGPQAATRVTTPAAAPTQSMSTQATPNNATAVANSAAAPRATTQTAAGVGASPSQAAGAGATANQSVAASPSSAGGGTAVQSGSTPSAKGPFRAYAVQPGDTVKFVAQIYGVSPASISQASGLQNPDRLRVGQVLTIPLQPGWLYRVQPGETLDQIAARTGVPIAIIVSASGLATDTVQVGDVILIPDQAIVASK